MTAYHSSLRSLYDSPIGDRLRTFLGFRPPINIRPMARDASVSDLFPWRVDSTWETCFELMNLPSLIHPSQAAEDHATLMIFAGNGDLIGTQFYTLAPFEARRIEIGALLDGISGVGSFACFHDAPSLEFLAGQGVYLSDRGYVGFRRHDDELWSHTHGNLNVLARRPNGGRLMHIAVPLRREAVYSPQMKFDDALAFDLIYSNPTDRPLKLSLRFAGAARTELKRYDIVVPIRGTVAVSHTQTPDRVSTIEGRARTSFWRPIIFKYYPSHFDVFHG